MSKPNRFDPLSDGMWENSAGDYVLYAEYARLKAENERLRKAGDAMAAHILKIEEEVYEVTPCGGYYVIDEWNAAKEGKQL